MNEPVLGWRIWNLGGGRLASLVVDYRWEPNENVATCLTSSGRACSSSPGRHCECGFWAVWTPSQCVLRASVTTEPPWHVMGLITGWGTVAMHGREGFRAERAALRCLFTDRPWSTLRHAGAPGRLARWCRRTLGMPWPEPDEPEERQDPGRLAQLEAVAARYGVPLVSLRAATELGLLGEMGVPATQIEEAARLSVGAAASE